MNNEPAPRKLKISILRFNPQERGSVPRMVPYELDVPRAFWWPRHPGGSQRLPAPGEGNLHIIMLQ